MEAKTGEMTGWVAPEVDATFTFALTAFEVTLLKYLGAGLTNGQIALRVHRSEKTVRNRLSMLYRRLGATNRAQAVAVFLRREAESASPAVGGGWR